MLLPCKVEVEFPIQLPLPIIMASWFLPASPFQIKQTGSNVKTSLGWGILGTVCGWAGFESGILSHTRGEAGGHIAAQSLYGQ